MKERIAAAAALALFTSLLGCGPAPDVRDPLDYQPVPVGGKADGGFAQFEAGRLVSDDAFFDAAALTGDDVQLFLEKTPYGTRSFLADETLSSGERMSDAVARVASADGLNPLVLLVTLQKEAGLISAETSPGGQRVDYAFGCGCSDGAACEAKYRGLGNQLECAGEVLKEYGDQIASGGKTIAGLSPGKATRTLDGVTVTPANRATAILYTYTPWVLRGTGGNWLFWNIWRRYASDLGYERGLTFPLNAGYIGGPCDTAADCFYQGAICLPSSTDRGKGVCSLPCSKYCPDHGGSGWATTFCADIDGTGYCLAQCDAQAPQCNGAEQCATSARYSEPSVTRDVCMP